ncbi:helix-turn-helix transcriptional regulator [Virgibacillus sp. YIM 98842]|uniref:helix-turn-helix transcriptional regulator n=1 Tax=Virgibacillus sp. YIM 98842 TaxID=2663533 RepID=UPI0013DB95BB|nr:helix-turn-helix transcriptional regulator [Virgibacillus sp. YIM 98842]
MKVGKHLKGLRDRKDYTQENVATDLHISKPLVSHLEKDRRNMTKELAKQSVAAFNDAQYGFEIARETARDYITPLATANKAIEWHRLALEETFKREAAEAIEHFNNVSLAKHPDFATDEEIQEIKIGVKELLDVQTTINSFIARLEQVYPVTVKECMQKRLPEWKAKGWII